MFKNETCGTRGRTPERTEAAAQAWPRELSETARQFVRAAALVGETFVLHDVARVLSVTTLSLLPALDEAVAASLIRFDGDRLAFRSAAVRQRLSADIPAPLREMLRRVVIAPPAAPPTAAPPTSAAPTPATPDTTAPSPAAPTSATPSPPGTPPLVASLLLAQESLSRPLPARTRALLREALDAALPGHEDEAAQILGLCLDDERGQREQARSVLARYDRGPAAVVAATVLSNLEWAAGRLDTGLLWGRAALRMTDGSLPPAWRPYPQLALAVKLIQVGRVGEGRAELARMRVEAERQDNRQAIADSTIEHGRLLLGTGRITEAETDLAVGVALADRLGAATTLSQGLSLLAVTALRRGAVDEAAGHVRRARVELAAEQAVFPSLRHAWVDFLVTTAGTDPRSAGKLLAGQQDALIRPPLFLRDHGAAAQLVRLARAAGHASLAATVVRKVERLAARNAAQPSLLATVEHARGLLRGDATALEHAARTHGDPWAAAMASEDLGMLHLAGGRAGDGGTGRDCLRVAWERYSDIGARADATRVETRLRELGGAAGAGTSSAPPGATAGIRATRATALTEAESRIAQLVATGLTNQQVAKQVGRSPHTVNYHLRQIFRKLGVSSRVELARTFPAPLPQP
ncbi:LuxR C-terminal-related transcriptional regulator [Streptomyces sp. NPDC058308]|uniref:LuxR C-terminal-related transcriptional regulator n=1 Tax=Streptomyces sp. NPDC058308 TaxID=3346440 RepID=UPI0036E93486